MVVPVIAVILFLGVYPKPVLDRINPAACQTVAVAQHGGAFGWTMYKPLDACRSGTRGGGGG